MEKSSEQFKLHLSEIERGLYRSALQSILDVTKRGVPGTLAINVVKTIADDSLALGDLARRGGDAVLAHIEAKLEEIGDRSRRQRANRRKWQRTERTS